jgi:hypothetical protein
MTSTRMHLGYRLTLSENKPSFAQSAWTFLNSWRTASKCRPPDISIMGLRLISLCSKPYRECKVSSIPRTNEPLVRRRATLLPGPQTIKTNLERRLPCRTPVCFARRQQDSSNWHANYGMTQTPHSTRLIEGKTLFTKQLLLKRDTLDRHHSIRRNSTPVITLPTGEQAECPTLKRSTRDRLWLRRAGR